MSDLFALAPLQSTALIPDAPLPTAPGSGAEIFDIEYEAVRRTGRFGSREANYHEEYERAAEGFRAIGIDPPPNPYGAMRDSAVIFDRRERDRRRQAWVEASDRARAVSPDLPAPLPHQIEAEADARALAAGRRAEAMAAVEGFSFSGMAGGMVSALRDPVQWPFLALGAWARGGAQAGMTLNQALRASTSVVARTAAQEAALAAVAQGVVESRAAPFRQELGLQGNAAENIGMAAAGGAVLGGGLRGLLEGWRITRLGSGGDLSAVPTREADAAMLVDQRLRTLDSNPAGPEGLAAHEDAADVATAMLARGRQASIEVPPAPRPRGIELLVQASAEQRLALSAERIGAVLDSQGSDTAAAWRDDIGAITVEWGRPGDERRQFRGGFGLSHILARRAQEGTDGTAWVREVLPRLLNEGQVTAAYTRTEKPRIDLEWNGHRAVLQLQRDGQSENWLLTGFPLNDGPGGAGGLSPTPPYTPRPADISGAAGAGPPLREIAPRARRFNTFTPAGRAVFVEPRVVELSELIPSHRPDGAANPAYPHAEGVQPRDRSAAPSQDQVRAIAAGLVPERLGPNVEAGLGAPIIGPDLVVESGNGRVMALAQVYTRDDLLDQRMAYRSWLHSQGYAAADFRQPVLVSGRISALTPEQRRAFVREANGRSTLAGSAAETATQDAAALDSALSQWRGGQVDSAANAPFVRGFLAGLTEAERGDLLTSRGALTQAGIRRIEAAMIARAYGDAIGPLLARWLDSDNKGMRGLVGALTDAAGGWARMRQAARAGEIDATMDITPELGAALRTLDEARVKKLPVAELVVQQDLDLPPLTDTARALLASLHQAPEYRGGIIGRERLAARLDGYTEAALRTEPQSAMLPGLGLDAISPMERLALAVRRADAEDSAARAAGEEGVGSSPMAGLLDTEESVPVFRFDTPPADARSAARGADTPPADARTAAQGAQTASPSPAPARAADTAAESPVHVAPDSSTVAHRQIAAESFAADAKRPAPERIASAEELEAQRIAGLRNPEVPIAGAIDGDEALTRSARDLLDEADDMVTAADNAAACLIGGAA